MARDLHDTVIQRLFAVGLALQGMAAAAEAAGIADRLNAAISDLDDTIRQGRSTIYELGFSEIDRGLRSGPLSPWCVISPRWSGSRSGSPSTALSTP